MSETDPLSQLFAESEAPAMDLAFTLSVIAEVERREALRTAAWRLAYVGLALVLLVAGWPALVQLGGVAAGALISIAPFLAVGVLAVAVTYWRQLWALVRPAELAAF